MSGGPQQNTDGVGSDVEMSVTQNCQQRQQVCCNKAVRHVTIQAVAVRVRSSLSRVTVAAAAASASNLVA